MTETETAHHRESLPLDSTAQLLSRISTQLGTQLRHVALNGTRRRMPHTDRHIERHTDRSTDRPTLVAVAHGSRDPRALSTVTALLDRVRELRPGLDVRLGHIELNEPLLPETLGALGHKSRAVLVPLMLSRGYHVKQDLPQAAAAFPGAHIRIAAPLGPHPLLVEALRSRLVEAGWRPEDGASRRTGVVLAAAGSRDPESAADTRHTADLLSERLGGVPVVPAYASAAAPTVAEAVRALTARGRDRIAVASYFAFPGLFATAGADLAPWIAAAPIGAHPALARLLLQRYDSAVAQRAPATERRELAAA